MTMPSLLLVALTVSNAAVQPLPVEIDQAARRCIDYLYRDDFQQATKEARTIIRTYPDRPAGYFFYAVVLDSWMAFYQSDSKEDEFYHYCDLAIEKGEALAEANSEALWPRFFVGGAHGYKGTYESRYGRWITAFRHGWKGVSVLLELRKEYPRFKDVYFGIATYDYWRSAMTRVMVWMPGVEDKRESAINMLQVAKAEGTYTRMFAADHLLDILANEQRYEEMLELAGELLKQYPTCVAFHRRKGKALYHLKRYDEAEKTFRYVLGRVEAEAFDNHYNGALCHLWLARIALRKKQYTRAVAECNRMHYYSFGSEVKKRLAEYFKEAERIKKQATAARLKGTQPERIP